MVFPRLLIGGDQCRPPPSEFSKLGLTDFFLGVNISKWSQHFWVNILGSIFFLGVNMFFGSLGVLGHGCIR